MKINYKDEDYKGDILSIVIFSLLIAFVCTMGIINSKSLSDFIFYGVFVLIVLPFFIITVVNYVKHKRKRNLNLFIMKNGICSKGKIISIREKHINSINIEFSNSYDIYIAVEFEIDGEKKEIAVDGLRIENLNKAINKGLIYINKEVNVYVYNNMSYVDILNS